MNGATTMEELQSIGKEALQILIDCGFTKPPCLLQLADKTALVKALTLHHVILRSKAELDQLRDGLNTLGVASALASNPMLFEPLFTAIEDAKLTSGIG